MLLSFPYSSSSSPHPALPLDFMRAIVKRQRLHVNRNQLPGSRREALLVSAFSAVAAYRHRRNVVVTSQARKTTMNRACAKGSNNTGAWSDPAFVIVP